MPKFVANIAIDGELRKKRMKERDSGMHQSAWGGTCFLFPLEGLFAGSQVVALDKRLLKPFLKSLEPIRCCSRSTGHLQGLQEHHAKVVGDRWVGHNKIRGCNRSTHNKEKQNAPRPKKNLLFLSGPVQTSTLCPPP